MEYDLDSPIDSISDIVDDLEEQPENEKINEQTGISLIQKLIKIVQDQLMKNRRIKGISKTLSIDLSGTQNSLDNENYCKTVGVEKIFQSDNDEEKKSNAIIPSNFIINEFSLNMLSNYEQPEAAQVLFQNILSKLYEFVVNPFFEAIKNMDDISFARLSKELMNYGKMTCRTEYLSHSIKGFNDYTKVNSDEINLDLPLKLAPNSAFLPTNLFRLSTNLGFGFVNDLENKMIYLTYSTNIFLEISYENDNCNVSISVTNESGQEEHWNDEARDIMDLLQYNDDLISFEILQDSLYTLINRSKLIKQLDINILKKFENQIYSTISNIHNIKIDRVLKGFKITFPDLLIFSTMGDNNNNGLTRFNNPLKSHNKSQNSIDRYGKKNNNFDDIQVVNINLNYKHNKHETDNSNILISEKISDIDKLFLIVVTLNPKICMGISTIQQILTLSALNPSLSSSLIPSLAEGIQHFSLLSEQSRNLNESNISKQISAVSIMVYIIYENNLNIPFFHLDIQNKDSEEYNLASTLHGFLFSVSQLHKIPELIKILKCQLRYNKLLLSLIQCSQLILPNKIHQSESDIQPESFFSESNERSKNCLIATDQNRDSKKKV